MNGSRYERPRGIERGHRANYFRCVAGRMAHKAPHSHPCSLILERPLGAQEITSIGISEVSKRFFL
jgi:hypothetical protein